jgi:hypothetical protein
VRLPAGTRRQTLKLSTRAARLSYWLCDYLTVCVPESVRLLAYSHPGAEVFNARIEAKRDELLLHVGRRSPAWLALVGVVDVRGSPVSF